MRVLGLAGWSGSGKTTLVVKLIPALVAHGLRVSTIKHAHHEFDVDQPGKDSYRHRAAGAAEVLVASSRRWALMHEHRGGEEPSLDVLLAKLEAADLVLVEGFRRDIHAKIEIRRSDTEKPWLAPDDPHIVAIATDLIDEAVRFGRPVLPIEDAEAIAAFVVGHMDLWERP